MSAEISQADLLREWIEKKFDSNYDYSKSSYKKNDRIEFVKSHPELDTTEAKIRKHFDKILREVAEQKGKPAEAIGTKKPKVNSAMIGSGSDMQATIQAMPQSPQLVGSPTVVSPQVEGQLQSGMPQINPTLKGNHDVKAVSAALSAFYLVLKTGFAPLAEELTDDEKESLGNLGKPVFDRFFGENEDLVICFLGIGGVMMPKLAKGRKLKKEQQAKERKESEEKPDE